MSFQTHYYPRAGVGLHSSWGGWDGGNLGYMGTVVVWDPPGSMGKEKCPPAGPSYRTSVFNVSPQFISSEFQWQA